MTILAILLAGCGVSDIPPQSVTITPAVIPPTATVAPKAAAPTLSASVPTAVPTEGPAAARVNGRPVPLAEFEKNVARRQVEMTQQGIDLTTAEGKTALAEMRRQILEGMIEQELIDQEVAKQGITVTQAEVDAAVNQRIADSGGVDAFNKYLSSVAGMTVEEYREGQREGIAAAGQRDSFCLGGYACQLWRKTRQGSTARQQET